MPSPKPQVYEEVRVYEGVAERTGVQFERSEVRHSEGCCGSLTGYHCRGPADTCSQQTDCPAPPAGQFSGCQYAPEVAHWQCVAIMPCNG